MIYEVQAWDDLNKIVMYYTVADVIDYEDARDLIANQHPTQKIISVIKKNHE
jgi:hypothetical protein